MSQVENPSSLTANPEVEQLQRDLAVNRAMADNSPINIIMANTDLTITYVNPASVKTLKTLSHLLPCRVEEITGKSIDIFHKNPSHQRKLLANERNLPHRAVIELGPEKLDLLVSPVYDGNNKYLGPMVTWEVVTDKLARDAVNVDLTNQLEAIKRFQAVIEFNVDGTVITANDNFCKALGYSLSEIQGKHHRMFCDSEYTRSREYSDFWATLNRGEFQTADYKRFAKGGREIWISASYNPICDASGKVVKVVKFASEITDRVRLQAAAAEKTAIVENAPINIMLADATGTITYVNPASMRTLRQIERLLPIRPDQIVGASMDVFHKNPGHQRRIISDAKNLPYKAEFALADEVLSLQASAIFDDKGNYAGPMVSWEVITERKKAEQREKENADRERQQQQELTNKVNELMKVVTAAANGDLTREVTVTGDDAMGQLAGGVRRMIGDLRSVISQVVEGAAQFAEGARIIAENSQNLAQGSQTQSASVEEMSASIEELTRSIESVKDNAGNANRVAVDTSKMAVEGGQAVQKSIEAMDLIKNSSEQISEIIQVISEIASQTNLLALNAAIEAARAGEHGLGFAVVADEVRKLAERSSEAAKEISKLIRESTQRVADGAKLSEQTGKSLERIISGVDATAKKISEIASVTVEQAQNANEVANAIQQVSKVTEQSAAASEEMASSSEELGAQATSLRDLVRKFKVS